MTTLSGSLKTPFEAQLAFFRRKVNVPTARWADLWREQQAHGFMVAGVARADLLEDMRQLVERAQAGQSFKAFKSAFGKLVDKSGWDPRGGKAWRAKVIYDTNVRQAFNAGRYAQLTNPDMIKVRPYWIYQHSPESRVPRVLHKSWDRVVLRHDDPWWRTHMPMNGWGCRCRVRAISQREIDREGLKVLDRGPDDGTRDWTDPVTGEVHTIPNGIDPGFDYNVGQAAQSLPAAAKFGEKVVQLPPAWRDIALQDAQSRQLEWFGDWPGIVGRIFERVSAGVGDVHGVMAPIGFLRPDTMNALQAAGTGVTSALIAASEDRVLHSLRDAKWDGSRFDRQQRDAAAMRPLSADLLEDIPRRLSVPGTSVLWDDGAITGTPGLIYATKLESDQWFKYVFAVDFRNRNRGPATTAVWFRTLESTNVADLRRMRWLEGPKP